MRRQRNSFVPCIETLESRTTPSTLKSFGPFLFINGTQGPDTVVIDDAGNGTVTVTLDGGTPIVKNGIRAIYVDTKGDVDNVTYNLLDDRIKPMAVAIKTGTGNDTVDFNLTGDIRSLFGIALDTGLGDDDVTFDYTGEIDHVFGVVLNGNRGEDEIVANIISDSGSTGRLGVAVLGGNDNDDLELTITDTSSGGLKIKALLDGGNGTDTAVASPGVKQTRIP